jgi:hypothetical protein
MISKINNLIFKKHKFQIYNIKKKHIKQFLLE